MLGSTDRACGLPFPRAPSAIATPAPRAPGWARRWGRGPGQAGRKRSLPEVLRRVDTRARRDPGRVIPGVNTALASGWARGWAGKEEGAALATAARRRRRGRWRGGGVLPRGAGSHWREARGPCGPGTSGGCQHACRLSTVRPWAGAATGGPGQVTVWRRAVGGRRGWAAACAAPPQPAEGRRGAREGGGRGREYRRLQVGQRPPAGGAGN